MPVHIVSYDLIGASGERYEAVEEAIVSCGGQYWRFQRSVWIIATILDVVSVRGRITPLVGPHDKVYVGTLEGTAAWSGYAEEGNKWLMDVHLGARSQPARSMF